MSEQALSKLASIYYDPATGLSSVEAMYKRVKELGIKLSRAEIADFISKQETNQVFHRRRVKHYYPLISYSPFSRVQIDLADVSQLTHWNSGVKFLFCCVDVYSRYAFVIPIKSKGENEAFKTVVESIEAMRGFPPVEVDSDQEASFLSRSFKAYCDDKLIGQKLLPIDDYKGTAMVDAFIRTLRDLLNKYLTAYETKKYVDVLPELVINYNTRVNQGIKSTPQNAVINPEFEKTYWAMVERKIKKASEGADSGNYHALEVGEKVRVMIRLRKLFDKGTSAKWSKSVHTVSKMEGGLYYVSDRVSGYKVYELQRVGEDVSRLERMPRDGEASQQALAREELEAEEARVEAGRRMERAMRKEGIEKHPERVEEKDEPVRIGSKPARVRRQVDPGAFVRE
jgi:hypothetical protein